MHRIKQNIRPGRLALVVLLALTACSSQQATQDLAAGDMAPAFTLNDQNGKSHSLADYRGHKVLVYFYPKDFTSGCTTEACAIRDEFADYREAGIVVLGISGDSEESHKAFEQEHQLPFTLLADIGLKVASRYGAAGSLNFARRQSFLIDESGKLLAILRKVNPGTHSQDVLAQFRGAAGR